ncbi:GGDEF domain-containing protein [Dactylosporangium salmoneum]|uniref:GGDEF domain-containing protein n=1 Tax=Dactylosporangium salmoneum TaxID=53361 RepID=A0ABP5TDD1_9ACTN
MSDDRRAVPGRQPICASLLLIAAALLLLVLSLVVVADHIALAGLAIMLAMYVLVAAAFLALAGLGRATWHLRDLRQHLAEALTDPVTGLPVRRVAETAIAGADPDVALSVALADVDGLHDINHGPGGHAAGDRYLAEVGRRLRAAASGGDVVARLGGDEFVVITRRTPQQLAGSLTAAFAAPAAVAGFVGPVEVSVGISQLPGGDPHQLLSCASLAMFTAKDRRTGIQVYDPDRDGLPLPHGVRPAHRRRDRRTATETGGGREVLSFNEAEADGSDGTGPDGDPLVPYTMEELPPPSASAPRVLTATVAEGACLHDSDLAAMAGQPMDALADRGPVAETVDAFDVYRAEPEVIFEVPPLVGGQPPLTVALAALGGGTVGRAYADTGWIYAVYLDGIRVVSGTDLRSGRVARTHRQMAAVLLAALAGGDAAAPGLAAQGERMSWWAGAIEEGQTGA